MAKYNHIANFTKPKTLWAALAFLLLYSNFSVSSTYINSATLRQCSQALCLKLEAQQSYISLLDTNMLSFEKAKLYIYDSSGTELQELHTGDDGYIDFSTGYVVLRKQDNKQILLNTNTGRLMIF